MVDPTYARKGSIVGLSHAQVWLVGPAGHAYGTAGPKATNGTTTHALLLKNPNTAQLPSPARVVTPLRGGNRWLGQVMFGINEVGAFPLTLNDADSDFFALATASTVDTTTNARWARFSDNIMLNDLPQCGMMLTTIFQSRDDGSDGYPFYINYIIPRCQIQPILPQMAYQAENVVTYTVSPTIANAEPHGVKLSQSSGMKLKDGKCAMYAIVSSKPLAITTYINAAIPSVTFNLGYLPTDSSVAAGDCANEHGLNGVLTALASVNLTTGQATKAAAGDAGDISVVLYETDFVKAA